MIADESELIIDICPETRRKIDRKPFRQKNLLRFISGADGGNGGRIGNLRNFLVARKPFGSKLVGASKFDEHRFDGWRIKSEFLF
jgi:hypothetical protein